MKSMNYLMKTWMAGVALLVVLMSGASANAQEHPGIAAISRRFEELRGTSVYREYYSIETSKAPPQIVPDGAAYQHFAGTLGSGAIYWTPKYGAVIVYGEILNAYLWLREHRAVGYPVRDSRDGPRDSCVDPTTKKTQRFSRLSDSTSVLPICLTVNDSIYYGSVIVIDH